ncbi:MAG: hypothetical protein UT24_C0008G0007 [Candidatus Woesebacteria bacterium GW2011_GWB1_39_12]|uniref:AtpZ/AtpI family protein n=2 Tax=Candidatus Woeseibacteriota TaxID=1752722 RepID=A0A0G0LZX8_9BACT|nr:MAG: hypothetical protein UT23_C0012G0093 [Candidatus Woesebacteria bacterium GW2011_GWA1_39_12]KKR00879.1 MAG: hypothetical protein UT24_C0008G0007 [Candidatus Woesebacteria bacterium GW2011_GWB1_39_12]
MEKNKKIKPNYEPIIRAFGEASMLSFSFVFFPVVFLLIGVWLDKKFNTLPVFIVAGIILGIIIFIYQVHKALKAVYKDNK